MEFKKIFNFSSYINFETGANDILDVIDLSWNHLRQKGAIAVANGIKVKSNYVIAVKLSHKCVLKGSRKFKILKNRIF